MNTRDKLQDIIDEYSPDKWTSFFRAKSSHFSPKQESLAGYEDNYFEKFSHIGDINFSKEIHKLIIVTSKVKKDLSERSSRKAQYDKTKKILKDQGIFDAGIFIFYDDAGNFRFSLIHEHHLGTRRTFSNFRRFTYFVHRDFTNKTFLKQIADKEFSNLNSIKEAFSLAAVTDAFYKEFFPVYEKMTKAVTCHEGSKPDEELAKNFTLLFAIRVIFIGFIQKRKWIGNDDRFLLNIWHEYKKTYYKANKFYKRWLEPLFFEALAYAPGRKVAYGDNDFSKKTENALQMAPYLNGGLFLIKKGYDDLGLYIPDEQIEKFFEFLFSYNFTIEENRIEDEDLQLNPEFLGIIFERLVNKADGAVYTPRTEVDLMCRLSLVKWLEKNNKTNIPYRDLYELFFREGGIAATEDEQRHGSFSNNQYKNLLNLLENITICDPAVGSGAFPVGMMAVIDEVEQQIRERIHDPDYELSPFERKKRIISSSLYGVEVKEWAVWISQLRLWISLFIDAPEDLKLSQDAILPSLDFKMRCGDSLVQRIAGKMFPVAGHANIKSALKAQITQLKTLKTDYFQNKIRDRWEVEHRELALFRKIIDEEIEEKKREIDKLKGKKAEKQFSFLKDISKEEAQKELNFHKNKIDEIELYIKELQAEKQAIRKDEHPLVWNIEFAEIFADRDGFDIVIGNPPYVRQEGISDPTGKIKENKEYKAFLKQMVTLDFPKHFLNIKGKQIEKIDARSDLYTYFYIRALRLLNKKGVLTFICSNSWLDVGYGTWLQYFLLKNSPPYFIIDNHAKRSFEASDVNTIISVINAPQNKIDDSHQIKFIAYKKPFEDVIFTENLLWVEEANEILTNNDFRVYPITVDALCDTGTEYDEDEHKGAGGGRYIGDKWGGKYLRAPDIFFTVLKKGSHYTDKLFKYFNGERYLNTGGADGFFILTKVNRINKTFSDIINDKTTDSNPSMIYTGTLENQYLIPLIKDVTKNNKSIIIDNYDAYCFVANNTLTKKAKQYIKWGEKQGYNTRSVTKNQNPWYKPTIQMRDGVDILLPRSFNDTFIIHRNPNKYLSLRFYRLHLKKDNPERLLSFLNSTMFWLIYETLGNKNLGLGAIDFFMADFLNMRIPIVLDDKMKVLFNRLKKRQIKTIFEECGINLKTETPIAKQEPKPLSDRAELDNIVFDALDLTKDERKEVYRAVCQLVWNRISKAKSV
jgi:hypothetical protein